MNVFDTHRQIVGDYAEYIHSFTDTSDPEIERAVKDWLSEGRLWPQPLLQFNPAYEQAGTIEVAITAGKLLRIGLGRTVEWTPPPEGITPWGGGFVCHPEGGNGMDPSRLSFKSSRRLYNSQMKRAEDEEGSMLTASWESERISK